MLQSESGFEMKSLLKQFARPSKGWWRIAGWIMARTNRGLNAWTVGLLDIRPGERILEVGFGPGLAIRMIAAKTPRVLVDGIDVSVEMVRQAGRRNAWAIRQGQVALRRGSVDELPYRTEIFDKVFAVDNVRDWPDVLAGFREICRVLKPGGLVAITVQPRKGEIDGSFAGVVDSIRKALGTAGFTQVRLVREDRKPVGVACVLAQKHSAGGV